MSECPKDLSVIIACYNEEEVLWNNFHKIKEILDSSRYNYEIIMVDDCSRDKTIEIAEKIVSSNKNARLIRHTTNDGRGKTVEDGIRAANGRIAGFLDIDLQVPAHYILPLAIEIEKGADVATAFRVYAIRFHILDRIIASKGYRFLFNHFLKTGIKDSETGYKFFNREKILPVLDEIKDRHWFWDTEVMTRAYLHDYVIKELPCLCLREIAKKSTVKLFKDSLYYFVHLWKFKKEVDRIRKSEGCRNIHVKECA